MLIGGTAIGLIMALSVIMFAVLCDRHVQRVSVADLRDRAVTLGLRPLAQVGSHLDGLAQGRRARLGRDLPSEVAPLAERLDRLLDDRDRELTRARIRTDASHGRAEITRVVDRLIGALSRMPAGAGIEWRRDVPPGIAARIDPNDLTEALGALLENTMRHARSRVALTMRIGNQHPDLLIRDDGPGVPPAALEHLVQRGVRLDRAGDGQGMGLAIATDIAEAAGGTLILANAGPGLLVRLRLQRHQP